MTKIPVRQLNKQTNHKQDPGFNILGIHQLIDGRPMHQPLHRHDFYFILFIQNGSGTHHIDFESYKIDDSSVFILKPGQVHELQLDSNCTGYIIQFSHIHNEFSDHSLYHLIRNLARHQLYLPDPESLEQLSLYFSLVEQEHSSNNEMKKEAIASLLKLSFILLHRITPAKLISGNASIFEQNQLYEYLDLLENNFTSLRQVANYASLMNITPYQLNRILKRTLNQTCSETINDRIILESKRYLLTSTNQIKNIAHLLGFEDTSYFIRFFKKHAKLSPEAFREKFK